MSRLTKLSLIIPLSLVGIAVGIVLLTPVQPGDFGLGRIVYAGAVLVVASLAALVLAALAFARREIGRGWSLLVAIPGLVYLLGLGVMYLGRSLE